jgi:glycosyltransferase involved in cell wall biosynthesis
VPALLRRAAVAACPALEEGFGLPALEALACGAPLVTTDGTAMAEVAEGAAVLVPPGSVTDLADALEGILRSHSVDERRRRGIEVAHGYTWEASIARHREAYAMAMTAPK